MQGLCLRHLCRLYTLYVNMAHLEPLHWTPSSHLCFRLPRRLRVCVYMCECVCRSSHASRHGGFLLSCGSPFVFSSGCCLLSRRCSSCCSSTLSSTGNFWSCRSSFSLCFSHSGMKQGYCCVCVCVCVLNEV